MGRSLEFSFRKGEILCHSTNFLSVQGPFEDGIREVSFLPRTVANKPCGEQASTCQARACTGAQGFIHSEVWWLRETLTLRSFLRTSLSSARARRKERELAGIQANELADVQANELADMQARLRKLELADMQAGLRKHERWKPLWLASAWARCTRTWVWRSSDVHWLEERIDPSAPIHAQKWHTLIGSWRGLMSTERGKTVPPGLQILKLVPSGKNAKFCLESNCTCIPR